MNHVTVGFIHFFLGPIISYHQAGFLLESLEDLDKQLNAHGSRLYVAEGCPLELLKFLKKDSGLKHLFFEQDCEPIWWKRDGLVKNLCCDLNIPWSEDVGHTLWDPDQIIEAMGGSPPLTYNMLLQTIECMGEPPKPAPNPDWSNVKFWHIPSPIGTSSFRIFENVPSCSDLQLPYDQCFLPTRRIIGGEKRALRLLKTRIKHEMDAFSSGYFQPNQSRPNLLGPAMSLSAALALGVISVRKFYWSLREAFEKVYKGNLPFWHHVTGQLLWREYFYVMSRRNPEFDKIDTNPICLKIKWYNNEEWFQKWKDGMTGYPFIDAAMRQLNQEGWMHHSARNAAALFFTRGDLWLNWMDGARYFAEKLIDSDWSVNVGNWLWVSSSAFERVLNCSSCISPVTFGRRLEPSGDYIRRYVPELLNFSFEYIHEPWKAPLEIQEKARCIVGKDYPERMVIHEEVARDNQQLMLDFRRQTLVKLKRAPPHCHPSDEKEIYHFFWMPEECYHTHA
ncbi:cryptochrome-1-like [Artemia franciscana]|uniref:cryptochrome-1-like n=1 Tax=Artemia franciscana TaxID=6661 RepID=UPI0032D9BFA1